MTVEGAQAVNPGEVPDRSPEQDNNIRGSSGNDPDVGAVELGKQVQRARALKVQREELNKQTGVLKSQHQASCDALTTLQRRVHEETARRAKLDAEALDLRKQAAEVERQAAELRQQGDRLSSEAEGKQKECKDFELSVAKVEEEHSNIADELQRILHALDIG